MHWLPTANSVLGSRNVCATLDWCLLFDNVLLELAFRGAGPRSAAAGAPQQSDVPAVMQREGIETERTPQCV